MSNLIKSKLFQRPVPRLGEMSGGVNKLCQKVEEDERERQKRNSIRNGVKNEGVTEETFLVVHISKIIVLKMQQGVVHK